MKLRMTETLWATFVGSLLLRRDVETAGVIFAKRLETPDGPVFRAVESEVVSDDAYLIRHLDQLRLDAVAINRLVRRARERELSVFTVHTHPRSDSAWFSWADDEGDRRLMPSFEAQMDGPHGSIVVAASGKAIGRAWSSGTFAPVDLRIVGSRVDFLTDRLAESDLEVFSRQILALGRDGQERIRRARVGVVGAGGTGSVVAVQLAHLGVGEIVLVDGDRVEASNRPRILGARASDAGRTLKVDVVGRYASEAELPVVVRTVPAYLGGENELRALRSCDVVFSCVDRQTPRALLNRLAYDALVPVVDMGTAFRVDGRGRISSEAGRVVVIGPGRPCLACWGHIDPGVLRVEALPPVEREREVADGYVSGARVQQPSVIPFNTMVAGAAVIELLRLVAGLDPEGEPVERLAFSFLGATVRRNRLPAGTLGCRICRTETPCRSEEVSS